MPLQCLVVDDDEFIREHICHSLRSVGHEVRPAAHGREALALVQRSEPDLLITDVAMPGMSGLELFRCVRRSYPFVSVILITGHGSVSEAVDAVKSGAHDYLSKPFEPEELLIRVRRLEERLELERQLQHAQDQHRSGSEAGVGGLVFESSAMRGVKRQIDAIAPSDASVVILGESGTGKELVACALHEGSPRRGKPFVAVNCAAIPETLIEAELFGHERGAFTGATHRRAGRIQAAEGGTLLLDEVGEIPMSMQAKLLRVLQERRIEPLGTNRAVPFDVRILCATHRNLRAMVTEGRFREDLYYRLQVLALRVPPLRERSNDLPLLATHFYQRFARSKDVPELTPAAWTALRGHPFPGNVRELEHAIQHAVVMSQGGAIDLHHLPEEISGAAVRCGAPEAPGVRPLAEAMRAFERHCLVQALHASGGGRKRAADMLGIARKTLWLKLKQHGLSEVDGEVVELRFPPRTGRDAAAR